MAAAYKADQSAIGEILRRAAADFERNGLSRGAIRKCEQQAPEAFLVEGLRVMLKANDSAGYRFLALLLTQKPEVFQRLCDRWQFTRLEAITIAQRLQAVDANFDTRMTALLPDRDNTPRQFVLEGDFAERALEILDEISPGRRIVPIMRHLTEYPDRKIASKASLLIGKRLQNLAWGRRVVAESCDPRVRANAIECFWGLNTPDVVDLFYDCLRDRDNRVVGNAIIGLYEAKVADIADLVSRIANDARSEFRMTAAWTMGRIGDPRFGPILTPLAKDSHPDVRRAALRSMRGFHKQAVAARAELPQEEPATPEAAAVELPAMPRDPQPSSGPQRQFWS